MRDAVDGHRGALARDGPTRKHAAGGSRLQISERRMAARPNPAPHDLRRGRVVRPRGGPSPEPVPSDRRARLVTTNAPSSASTSRPRPTSARSSPCAAERIADLRAYLAEVTQEELDRVRGPNTAIGCPPASQAPRRRSACESSSATSGRTCSSPTVTWPSWKSSMRDASARSIAAQCGFLSTGPEVRH